MAKLFAIVAFVCFWLCPPYSHDLRVALREAGIERFAS